MTIAFSMFGIDNELKARIQKVIGDVKMLCILLGGSKSWKSDNCHDTDIIIIVERRFGKNYCFSSFQYEGNDIIMMAYDYWKEREFLLYCTLELASVYPENLIYGELPEICIDNYKALLLAYQHNLKTCFRQSNEAVCRKLMYWTLMLYYSVINNGSFELTDEQREIIQKCHDKQLPVSYRDELKSNIEKILKEKGLI